LLKLTLIHK